MVPTVDHEVPKGRLKVGAQGGCRGGHGVDRGDLVGKHGRAAVEVELRHAPDHRVDVVCRQRRFLGPTQTGIASSQRLGGNASGLAREQGIVGRRGSWARCAGAHFEELLGAPAAHGVGVGAKGPPGHAHARAHAPRPAPWVKVRVRGIRSSSRSPCAWRCGLGVGTG